MRTLLITGATGTAGQEVLKALAATTNDLRVKAAVRDPARTKDLHGAEPIRFDLEDPTTFSNALHGVEVLFLLRPPQISNTKLFDALIGEAVKQRVRHIIFLSVQGVQNSSIIPHHKIERSIRESGIDHTFLRPAYFMQNFTTTLRDDLLKRQQIFLPAGEALFTVVDVADVGRVAARVIIDPAQHRGQAYDLTNNERLSFGAMAAMIGTITGRKITYQSPSLLRFFMQKRREKVPAMFILVMIMLHYLPRFQKPSEISDAVEKITGDTPVPFAAFVGRELVPLLAG